jgi:GT2 family glycosyltransferase
LVAVVVLNWNGYGDTVRCMHTVLESSYPAVLPIVVDNASTDGSFERLRATFPEVEVLQAGDNLGYAGGNNVGLRRARDLGAEYFFVINNDTELPTECVGILVAAMEADPRIGLAGPRINDGTTGRLACMGGDIYWPRAEPRHLGGEEDDPGQVTAAVSDVDYVPGTAVMVRREAMEDVGLLPDDFFMYFEDVVWSLQFQAVEWRTVVVPGAAILHHESATMGPNSPRKLYYLVRNNVHFLKEWTPADLRRATWARFHWKLVKLAVRNFLAVRLGQVCGVVAGYRDGLSGVRGRTGRAF